MELTLNDVTHLLDKVSDLNKKYDEIARITGENYNIFNILKLSTNEVRTHSAILGDLLNPSGTHGFNDRFLKLFIETILLEFKEGKIRDKIELLDTSRAWCEIEYNAGFISADGLEGGRIDILIMDRYNHTLIIENKIFAGDQKNQLVRYNNAFKDAAILYLTLDGKKPSEESCKELTEFNQYGCINYKVQIIEWLELCKKEAVNHSLLRETLAQYINLIKELTNQAINSNMEKEIVDAMISNPLYLDAALKMSGLISEAKRSVVKKLLNELNKNLPDWYVEAKFNNKSDYHEVWLSNKLFWKTYSLVFTIQKDCESFEIGIYNSKDIASNDESFNDLKLQVKDRLANIGLGNYLNGKDWIYNCDYKAWEMSWPDILSGKLSLASDVKNIIIALEGIDL